MRRFLVVMSVAMFVVGCSGGTDTTAGGTDTTTQVETDGTSSTTSEVGSDPETAECVFRAADMPQVVAGYIVDLFASANVDIGVGELRAPTQTSTFVLADFDFTASNPPPETVFFTVDREGDQFMPGVEVFMQICNAATNKTTWENDVAGRSPNPTSDNTMGVEISMSGVNVPKSSGNYRIDGIMRVDGAEWMLVDRMDVVFE